MGRCDRACASPVRCPPGPAGAGAPHASWAPQAGGLPWISDPNKRNPRHTIEPSIVRQLRGKLECRNSRCFGPTPCRGPLPPWKLRLNPPCGLCGISVCLSVKPRASTAPHRPASAAVSVHGSPPLGRRHRTSRPLALALRPPAGGVVSHPRGYGRSRSRQQRLARLGVRGTGTGARTGRDRVRGRGRIGVRARVRVRVRHARKWLPQP